MSQQDTRDAVEEFRCRIAERQPTAEVAKWVETLSEEDRQQIAAEYERMFKDITEIWQCFVDLSATRWGQTIEAISEFASALEQWKRGSHEPD